MPKNVPLIIRHKKYLRRRRTNTAVGVKVTKKIQTHVGVTCIRRKEVEARKITNFPSKKNSFLMKSTHPVRSRSTFFREPRNLKSPTTTTFQSWSPRRCNRAKDINHQRRKKTRPRHHTIWPFEEGKNQKSVSAKCLCHHRRGAILPLTQCVRRWNKSSGNWQKSKLYRFSGLFLPPEKAGFLNRESDVS